MFCLFLVCVYLLSNKLITDPVLTMISMPSEHEHGTRSDEWVVIDMANIHASGGTVRLALLACAITQRPVVLKNICADRSEPGLSSPMISYIELMKTLTGASVSGVRVGSQTMTFAPSHAVTFPKRVTLDLGPHSIALHSFPFFILALYQSRPIRFEITGTTHNAGSPSTDVLREHLLKYLHPYTRMLTSSLQVGALYPDSQGRFTVMIRGGNDLDEKIPAFSPEPLQQLSAIRIKALASMDLAADTGLNTIESLLDLSFNEYDVPPIVDVSYTDATDTSLAVSVFALFGNEDGYDNDIPWIHSTDRFFSRDDVLDERLAEKIPSMALELKSRMRSKRLDAMAAEQLLPLLALHGGTIQVEEVTLRLKGYIAVLQSVLGVYLEIDRGTITCSGYAQNISPDIADIDNL